MGESSHPAYRPDIDGLRGIAVLAVVAYHAAPAFAPGGFIGVDVFFVISGFLISTIILKSLSRGSFSYFEFYGRRIKRIFPALIAMLALVWIVGWLMLFPDEYRMLCKHIAAGMAFISNIVLWKEAGYFDPSAELKPLLHLWSLGIEEQFYIVWPLLLAFTWRWRRFSFIAISLGLIASFALNVLSVREHPTSTFYLPPARFWELLAGCVLAHAQLFSRDRLETVLGVIFFSPSPGQLARRRNLQAIVGLGLIVSALALLDRHQLFPGWWALLPVTGTFLLISAGPETWVNRRVLSNRPIVFVGLISYPLYLWHWPLLSYLWIVNGPDIGWQSIAIAVTLAFLLATLTYHFIERPIRVPGTGLQIAWPLLGVGALTGAVAFVGFIKPLSPRSAKYDVDRILSAASEIAFQGPRLHRVTTPMGMLYEQGPADHRVLFFGDSNIEQYYPRIDKVLSESHEHARGVLFITSGGCPPLPGVTEVDHPDCGKRVELLQSYVARPEVEAVVIGAAWYGYFINPTPRYLYLFTSAGGAPEEIRYGASGFDKSLEAFESMVAGLVRQHKQVFIVLQIPVGLRISPRSIVKRSLTRFDFQFDTAPLSRTSLQNEFRPIVSRLVAIAARTGAHVIDPIDSLCDVQFCPIVTPAGEPIYRDTGHLRPSYVRDEMNLLDAVITPNSADLDVASRP